MKTTTLKEKLCHHVTGAIERGEAEAIAGIPAPFHTPGTWALSPYNNITSRNGTIAKIEQMPGNYDSEREANANLISAAPDLLEALRFLMADYIAIQGDKLTGSSVPIEKAKSAIAKAEGNQ